MAQYVYTMRRVAKIVPPKREILKNISLNFFPGAKIGVLGLNGSGKSSLLRIMAGLDTEIEGEARPQPGIKIGYLSQEPQLDPGKDVRGKIVLASGPVGAAHTLAVGRFGAEGVVSFYTMYNMKPIGRHHIQVCRTLPCALRGAEQVTGMLKRKLGIECGQTTADGRFTLSEVECLASCGTAPMMQVNDDYYENLTEEKIDDILDGMK